MASNTAEIQVAQLDFDLIKQNLISYFQSDSNFQDYEFEGAALNIIMDVLSYNTHMNAVIANMSGNEMFIDSSQLRQSVVSIAKAIGYTPRSKRTSIATIDLLFSDITGFPPYITMEAGTRFKTPNGFIYSTKEQELIYPKEDGVTGQYEILDVGIYEGYLNTFTYTVNYQDPDQSFVIPSIDADISTLIVVNKSGSIITEYARNENLSLANESSKIYFPFERSDGTFEIVFGDGILGHRPPNGTQIILTYVISKHGEEANNSDTFGKNQTIDNWNSYVVTTNTVAYGAAEPESIKSIRTKAPKMYKAQSRAVVTEDYENFLLRDYPWIDSMSIWGGEHNDPPIYGKVFIAIKPAHTEILADSLKDRIKEDLINKYNVVTVIPEIVDPEYLYINIETAVEYSLSATILTSEEIVAKVKSSVVKYFEDNTELFNKPFYFSKFTTEVDNSDVSIANSITDLRMMKRFYPLISAYESREIKYENAIKPGTVKSSYYNLSGVTGGTAKQYFLDDGIGNLYTKSVITGEVINTNIGSVDYEAGIIDINIIVYEVPEDTLDLRVYCTPSSQNIIPGYNQIILLDDSPVNQDYGRKQGSVITATTENKDYK